MPPDGELLRRYADQRDEQAFAELVRRHVGLVYGAALRQVGGDAHRAQEVAQAVFCDLARKAGALAGRAVLASWLHTSTRFAAGKLWRTEIRRWKNEREAGAMKALVPDSEESAAEWEKLRPVIDEVVEGLGEKDREAVLQRFFANRAYGEIAETLGVSEDAARMRVERALEKLRAGLAKRGLTSTSVALATVLGGQAAAAVPSGLAATLTAGALAAGATAGGGTAVVATKVFIHMSTAKVMMGVAGLVIVAAGVMVFRQQQATEALRAEVLALKSEKGAVAALRTENQRLIAEKKTIEDTARTDHEELVKLQAAREAFRKQLAARGAGAASAGTRSEATGGGMPAGMIPVDVMKDVGNTSPSATAETLVWAMQNGEVKRAATLLTFDKAEREKLDAFIQTLPENIRNQYKTPEELIAFMLSGSPRPLGAVQLLGVDQANPDEAVHHVQVQFQNGDFRRDDIHFRRESDGWKEVVSPSTVDRVITYFQGKK